MERFPALRLILKLGRAGAALVAAVATALSVWLAWGSFGWGAMALVVPVLPFSYFLAKSYVEIVQIITEMVH